MKTKKLFSALLAVTTALSVSSSVVSFAASVPAGKGCGDEGFISEETLRKHATNFKPSNKDKASIGNKCDLSTSQYFPPIGDQGTFGSCASWATTYYQFTYEANKLNGIKTTYQNSYSPLWTFNFTNGGLSNNGSNFEEIFGILSKQGGVLMKDYPYSPTNFDATWFSNEQKMIDALNTRPYDWEVAEIDISSQKITSPDSSKLSELKYILSSEKKVLTVRTFTNNLTYKKTENGELAICRATGTHNPNTDKGHAMVVVGYDDTIECDINGNDKIEDFERGALKLANSWGNDKNTTNNGYIWVMYDALNKVSASPTNWEKSEKGTRVPIFDRQYKNKNQFYSMYVKNYSPNVLAVLKFNTNDKYNVSINTDVGKNLTDNKYEFFGYERKANKPFSGSFVVAFGDRDLDMSSKLKLKYTTWHTELCNKSSSSTVKVSSYKIVDNKNNLITTGSPSSATVLKNGSTDFSATPDMQYGDVNYDGQIGTEDANLVLKIVVGSLQPSNMQSILADYNHDNAISPEDALAILRYVVS